MIKTILIDLDGTLLPFIQDEFIKLYFGTLTQCAVHNGYDAQKFVHDLYKGCEAMVKNDGSRTNHDAFWDTFRTANSDKVDMEPVCNEYYVGEFDNVKKCLKYQVNRKPLIESIKSAGFEVALATTPMFPRCAVKTRLSWVGLDESDFAYITDYTNSRFCKPNTKYYEELASKLGRKPSECLMIGNSVPEDMIPAEKLGMARFLASEFIENPQNADISGFKPQGTLDGVLDVISSL